MRFKIDWASHIVGSKFTVFVLFYFVFESNFPSTSPQEAYIWRGDLTEGFCVTGLGGLLERLRFKFTPNGKREFAPRDQVFPLFSVYPLLLLHKNK